MGGDFEVREEIGGPIEAAVAQPEFGEIGMATRRDNLADLELIGLRGGGGECERDVTEPEFEQPIAAPRLAIIIALRRCTAHYLDLSIVEPATRSEERRVGKECVSQ